MNFLHHICIQTNCYKESLHFYERILGMTLMEETPNFHGRDFNTWLKNDDFMIELQTGKKEKKLAEFHKETTGIVHICFYTDDIEVTMQNIVKCGYERFERHDGNVIYEVNGGKLFKMIAPEGTMIEFRNKLGI